MASARKPPTVFPSASASSETLLPDCASATRGIPPVSVEMESTSSKSAEGRLRFIKDSCRKVGRPGAEETSGAVRLNFSGYGFSDEIQLPRVERKSGNPDARTPPRRQSNATHRG